MFKRILAVDIPANDSKITKELAAISERERIFVANAQQEILSGISEEIDALLMSILSGYKPRFFARIS